MSFEPTNPQSSNPEGADDTFEATTGEPVGGTATMAPPPPPPVGQPRRLVRDPYTRLGGVASGVAHHYGLDVSLVRIVFLLAAFATGFGFFLYLLAWLVIPRADYWPPAGAPGSVRSLSSRDLGIGLAVFGLIVALAFGAAGSTGSVLIPLVLVGGGVWLLVQAPNQVSGSAVGQHDVDTPVGGGHGGSAPPPPSGHSAGGPAGAPVPPRSRRRRFGIVGLVIAGLFALVAIPVLLIIGVLFGVANGSIDVDTNAPDIIHRPATVEAIPNRIVEDAGDITIDLTRLDAADFDGIDTPVEVDARLDFGTIEVVVPRDLDVDVAATSDLGEVRVFGDEENGFGNSVDVDVSSPDVRLDLDVDVGKVEVVRG